MLRLILTTSIASVHVVVGAGVVGECVGLPLGSEVGLGSVGTAVGRAEGDSVSGENTALHTVHEALLRSPTTKVNTSSPVVC
jgi:hypothetical protein